ncbi:MAG: sugar transferase [Luteolibacter sp.]|uniref:sugar transferase n=1 Tax=Luteolibacter sp. TaxID=1962973 RepID=UPI003264BC6B
MLIVTGLGIIYFRPERVIQGGAQILNATFHIEDTIGMLILAAGWVGIFDYFIRYKADRLVALNTQVKNLVKATGFASFWLMIICAVFSVQSFNIFNILIFFAIVTTFGIVARLLLRLVLLSARRSGYNYRFLLVVGANDRAFEVADRIDDKPELGYKIVGFVAETASAREELDARKNERRVLGVLENLRTILTEERVDEIMVCLPVDSRFSDITMIVQNARDLGVVVRLMPNFADGTLLRNMYIEEFDDEYVVTLFREQLLVQLLAKRLIDASVSLAVLIILMPMMLVVAILIKLTSPGPVFFSQNRVGMNQRQFRLYKFRSMVADAEDRKLELQHLNERDGPAFKIENDPRTTAIGRFIRKLSIDELPQLLNVLSGEMSLVGPRPPLPDEVKRYEWLFRKRLSVKPGITCIWQISGRNSVSFEDWMEMDHEYIENWSLLLDLKILLKTVPAVLFGRGAS